MTVLVQILYSPLAPAKKVGAETQEEASLRNYQSVLILKPDLDEDQVDQSVEKITSVLQKFGGSILKLDKWGKKRLAYRVKKNKFGYYLNVYHTCEEGKVPDLEKEYQLYDLVIKYLVIRLEDRDIERVMSQAAEAAKVVDAAEAAKVAEAAEAEAPKPAETEEKEDSKKDVTTEKSE